MSGSELLGAAHLARFGAIATAPKVRMIHHKGNIGLAVHARMLVDAMRLVGIETDSRIFPYTPTPGEADINVLFCWPAHNCIAPGEYNIALTMTEADRIHLQQVWQLNQADACIVPSDFCREVFLRSGVTVPVYTVQTGITPPASVSRARPAGVPFEFLSIFEWSPGYSHKDPETLLRAYCEEFAAGENVRLIVKCSNPAFRDLATSVARDLGRDGPELRIIPRFDLTTDEIWGLHLAADCYVGCHHSEGWGLPMLDAMGAGLPVIATGYGANTDYMNQENSYLIDYSMIPIVKGPAMWAQPSKTNLRSLMRYVYDNPEEARDVGAKARAHVLANFTPERTGNVMKAVIAQVRTGGPPKPQKIPNTGPYGLNIPGMPGGMGL